MSYIQYIQQEEEDKERVKVQAEAEQARKEDAAKHITQHDPVAEAAAQQRTADECILQKRLRNEVAHHIEVIARPSRDDIINAIADHYEVDHFIALEWLEAEFPHIKAES